MSLQPRPSPPDLPPPTGVYGSLERLLTATRVSRLLPTIEDPDLGDYPNIWLYERPEQATVYPCIVIRSGKAVMLDETFEGYKLKEFPAIIEIYGRTDSEVASIARQIEITLEEPSAVAQIALWVGAQRSEDDAGVYLIDDGEHYDREHKRYDPAGNRTIVCRWMWRIGVKYLSNPNRSLPDVG